MNGITGATTQTTTTGPVPYNPSDVADLNATGFGFKEGGSDWDVWIDDARTSQNPETRAQYDALVELAGGRTHNAAIKDVMAKVQAMQDAASPSATASQRQAALNGMENQLLTMLGGMEPASQLARPLTNAAELLLSNPAYANTEWGQALRGVVEMQTTSAAFQLGIAEGIWEGGKSLVTGIVELAGNVLQYGADNSVLGNAGDMLRGYTGKMPGWLDAVIPSDRRGEASTAALTEMGKGIRDYVANNTASDIASDLGNVLDGAWEGLKADHAAARAQGPEAEARFLGKIIGRVGFEVAATFAGGAGIAGKAGKAGVVADAVVDGARAADKVADGARAADRIADGGKIAQQSADNTRAVESAGRIGARHVRYFGDGPLFRGDRRPPSEIFTEGLKPKGGTDDLAKYVKEHVDSIFVGTSKSQAVARGNYFSGGYGGYVYDIDASMLKGRGIDVNRTLGKHDMEHELEVAFPGGIPREAISGARQVLSDGSLGRIIENPHYKNGI